MRKAVYRVVRNTPPALVYVIFLLLLVLATAPAFRPVLYGLSVDDLLQLRCFSPV
ncbi:hypothetical protein I6F30_30325 [Bradyrhizobium sp. NBAIM20]|uniref:hypothetical protein n=1 Tax=unclassified Bradyrhizobium TaxID=2631580 RepID=UPI001CD5B104|nr:MULTISPECIES: hypothetical protein [unclassified Bradyrhizobium]MCA1415394.1 hypothetical protein [Bradyrhizobium sp. NBAIM20]MCA1460550.1 hypothetical protein [Bradyrhizobium sp. NBAIM18]